MINFFFEVPSFENGSLDHGERQDETSFRYGTVPPPDEQRQVDITVNVIERDDRHGRQVCWSERCEIHKGRRF